MEVGRSAHSNNTSFYFYILLLASFFTLLSTSLFTLLSTSKTTLLLHFLVVEFQILPTGRASNWEPGQKGSPLCLLLNEGDWLPKELKADRPHPRDYSTHRQTQRTDNDSSLPFAALGKAEPLNIKVVGQTVQP